VLLLYLLINWGNIILEDPYRIIVKDRSVHSYYLNIKIKNAGNSSIQEIAIQNRELYYFLQKYNAIKFDEYKIYILDIVRTDKNLVIKDSLYNAIIKHNYIVTRCKKIDSLKSIHLDTLLNYYFNNKVIKDSIPNSEMGYLIKTLIPYNIGCKTDCETGYLYCSSPIKLFTRQTKN
jgi:hypothetical protein